MCVVLYVLNVLHLLLQTFYEDELLKGFRRCTKIQISIHYLSAHQDIYECRMRLRFGRHLTGYNCFVFCR